MVRYNHVRPPILSRSGSEVLTTSSEPGARIGLHGLYSHRIRSRDRAASISNHDAVAHERPSESSPDSETYRPSSATGRGVAGARAEAGPSSPERSPAPQWPAQAGDVRGTSQNSGPGPAGLYATHVWHPSRTLAEAAGRPPVQQPPDVRGGRPPFHCLAASAGDSSESGLDRSSSTAITPDSIRCFTGRPER